MIILHCTKCTWAQSPIEVATNIAHPKACLNCGNEEFIISAESALDIHKMEKDNTNMHIIIDGAYG